VKKRLGFLLFCLIYLVYNLSAQQFTTDGVYIVNSGTSSSDMYSQKILTTLALGNNKDLKATQIQINFKLSKEINLIPDKIQVVLAFDDISIDGDTRYRGFIMDALLIPEYGNSRVRVFSQNKIVYNEIVEIPFSGKKEIMVPNNRSVNSTQLNIEVEFINCEYSLIEFQEFSDTKKLVNNYYGYSQILESLNKYSKEKSYINNDDASSVFLQWHKTARLNNLINELNLNTVLNLKNYDPEKFTKKLKELARHARRSTTLLNQTLNAELKRGFIADKQEYVNGLVDYSEEIYTKGKRQQPFLQEAYRTVTLLSTNAEEFEIIKRISDYYDLLSYDNNPKIPLLLHEAYVESAVKYFNNSKNNMALRQLKNANGIQEYFEYPPSKIYENTLVTILNSMIESFLKVSNMALKSGNYTMADNYYQNAEQVYSDNKYLFLQTNITATPFKIYTDAQTNLAKKLMIEKKFSEAEKLLSNCLKIQEEKGLAKNSETLILVETARKNIYNHMLQDAKSKLNSKQMDASLKLLYEAKDFSIKYSEVNETSYFDEVSYSVFLEYLQKSEILIDKGNYDEADKYLLKAKLIQTDLLKYEVEALEILLRKSSVPEIMHKIEEARFKTWAKKPNEAAELLADAKSMQKIYRQQDNLTLNAAIDTLEHKMSSRHCIDAKFALKEFEIKIEKQINEGDFKRAIENTKNAYSLINSDIDCALNTVNTDGIKNKYAGVYEFYRDYELMKTKLFQSGYDEVIEIYLSLRNNYYAKNIIRYNFDLPSLFDFVKQQNLTSLTASSVRYFTNNEQYQLAFEYLRLLKNQGMKMEDTKQLQIELGEDMSNSFEGSKEAREKMLNDLTQNDKWYKYFSREMSNKFSIFTQNKKNNYE